MSHVCKPVGWPSVVGDEWICPECLVPFVGTRLGDHDSDSSRDWLKYRVMDADMIGWVATAPSFVSARFPTRAAA